MDNQSGLFTYDEYENILKETKDFKKEVLPKSTDLTEWNKIKRLPKLLTDHLHANIRDLERSLELIRELKDKEFANPIVISASVDEANFLIQSHVVDIFFGGRWYVQVEVDTLPIGFCHEGYLMMVDLYGSSFNIDKDKTVNNEVLLGLNFETYVNLNCVFKWGGPITREDVEKRNRDVYTLQPGGLQLAHNTRNGSE